MGRAAAKSGDKEAGAKRLAALIKALTGGSRGCAAEATAGYMSYATENMRYMELAGAVAKWLGEAGRWVSALEAEACRSFSAGLVVCALWPVV